MNRDTGFLSLVTAPDVKAVADLRGTMLSVDALTTGYAFVLFDNVRVEDIHHARSVAREACSLSVGVRIRSLRLPAWPAGRGDPCRRLPHWSAESQKTR